MAFKESDAFIRLCRKYGVDRRVVAGIVSVESSGNPLAFRYEPGYLYLYKPKDFARALSQTVESETTLQRSSFGLMQIMGAVAREKGFSDYLPRLFEPDLNLEYGVRHFAGYLKRYGKLEDAIAAYNAGTVRREPLTGMYVNQLYVGKVLDAAFG